MVNAKEARDCMITVSDLITTLYDLPADAPVILQKDAEGNAYSPAVGACLARYVPTSTYDGEAYAEQGDVDEDDEAIAEHDADDIIDCVVIWPIN